MTTVKLKFRASSVPGAKGTLYYQLTNRRKVKCISTDHRLYPYEWDEGKETVVMPSCGVRRAELEQVQRCIWLEMKQWQAIIGSTENGNGVFSMQEMCDAFDKVRMRKTVFTFLQEQASRKEQMQRLGTAQTYGNAYRRFREFRGDVDLAFNELSPDMMERYEAWLIGRRLRQNSIRCYLRTLSTLFYKASEEGLLSDRLLFSRVRLSYVKTAKRAIGEKELKAIASLQLPEESTIAFARDLFMFSFYMRGMPFVDMAYLRKTDLKNGMLTYCRRKTNQCLTVAWEKAQQDITDRYASQTRDSPYLLPVIRKADGTEYRQYQRMQTNINRALKKIGAMTGLKMPLTTYVARHTWASIARDMNIPVAIISEGMGHSSLKTTQVYLNSIDTSRINEANKRIIRRISKG